MVIGQRQHHRDLAIVLLAEPATILARHADRVLPLFWKARIIDDPRLDRSVPFHLRHHHFAHLDQDLLVTPACLADEMQQRLLLGRNPLRRRDRRHRLDALAFTRQQQAYAIGLKWGYAIGVTDNACQFLDKGREASFAPVGQSATRIRSL